MCNWLQMRSIVTWRNDDTILYWNQIRRAQCRQFAIFNGIVAFDAIPNDRVTLINVQFMIYDVRAIDKIDMFLRARET